MLLPLAPRAQGAMKSSFGDDKRLARGGRGALVVERWLIRLLDRVHVGEARRTIELLACGPQSINARAHTFIQDVTRATSLNVEVRSGDCSYKHAHM